MSAISSPASLTELLRNQCMFIVARIADKTPINPQTCALSDATDPSTWMTAGAAQASVAGLGPEYGAGVVLSPRAPVQLACIDIDGAWNGAEWSQLARDLVAMFEGAYLEVSRSGRGMHIIFTYLGEFPAHAKKNTALSIELYHDKRYILLGTPQRGTPLHNGMAEAASIIAKYFPASADTTSAPADWTDGPVSAWHGPADDESLIKIGLNMKRGFKGALRDGASFKDLWTNNIEKLVKAFVPKDISKGTYDASGADLSLANKCAFLTGNDCVRMERLLRMSDMTRDKWNREDYMRRTILKACAAVTNWYNDGKGVPQGAAVPEANATGGIVLDDFRYYAPDNTFIFVPQREMWSKDGVDNNVKPWPNGYRPTIWLAQARQVHQMTWAPGHPLTIPDRMYDKGTWIDKPGHTIFNLYKPPTIPVGDASKAGPWLEHMARLYPNEAERDHLIKWFAHRRQRAHEKINHAVVLGGDFGIGKDTIVAPIAQAVGSWNFQAIEPHNLFDAFNPWVRQVVLQISEARDMGDGGGTSSISRYALFEKTKDLIAAPPDSLYCNEKNIRQYNIPNLVGVIFTTNHQDGLWLPPGDRRHFVLWSEVKREEFDKEYFLKLYKWYAAEGYGHIAAYLDAVDLSGFDPKAPPPETPAFLRMVSLGRAPEESGLADVLDSLGRPPAVTVEMVRVEASRIGHSDCSSWINDRKTRKQIPGRFESAGYTVVRNENDKHDGQWKVGVKRMTIYGRKDLSERDRQAAAMTLCRAPPPPGAGR